MTEKIESSSRINIISHVQRAYDYSGFSGYVWLNTKIVLKKNSIEVSNNQAAKI